MSIWMILRGILRCVARECEEWNDEGTDFRRRGTAHRAGGAGVRCAAAGDGERAASRPHARRAGAASARQRQRAVPGALSAGLFAARRLRPGLVRSPRLGPEARAQAVRILGARGVATAARPASVAALALG